jgi:hypothetical protein
VGEDTKPKAMPKQNKNKTRCQPDNPKSTAKNTKNNNMAKTNQKHHKTKTLPIQYSTTV